jgi:membrane protein DedA with SNARE-associated domain
MFNNLYHFHLITDALQPSFGIWAYILLAVLVAVEGPITTLTGAVAASAGLLSPIWVFLSASIGNLTADTLWYSLGYLGKTDLIVKYGPRFGLKENLIARIEEDVHNHIHKVLFIAKLTMGLVIPTLVAAGLARVPFKRWFGVLFTAECIWTGSLVLVGYYFGYLIQRIETNLRWISLGGGLILLIAAIFYLSHRKANLEGKS